MEDDTVYWTYEFKEHLGKYCSQTFIAANLSYFGNRIVVSKELNWIDITNGYPFYTL